MDNPIGIFNTIARAHHSLKRQDDLFDEESMREFCGRIEPKLSELEDFRKLEEFKDLAVSYETQMRALVTLLKWRDDGTVEVSKEFREFYDGLLFYSNLERVTSVSQTRALRELVNIFFEIHGSDPRNFPDTMKTGLHLFHQALTKHALAMEEDGLLDILAEAKSLGSHAADLLQKSLKNYAGNLGLDAESSPCEGPNRSESRSKFPLGHGFSSCAYEAQKSVFKDIRELLAPNKIRERQPRIEIWTKARLEAMDSLLAAHSERDGYFRIYVGPSGCGKTAKIHSLLMWHWGLYLLPGNLQNASDEPGLQERLKYQTRSNGGSRDTQTWLNDVSSMCELGLVDAVTVTHHAELVLEARLWILEQFCKQDPNTTPTDWLQVQTNCWKPHNDIFNHLYRVVRFTKGHGMQPNIDLGSKLLFCFDEAQCDLSALSPGGLEWPHAKWYQTAVRPLGWMNVAAFNVNGYFNHGKEMEVFLSGTALRLHHIEREIKSRLAWIETASLRFDITAKDSHDFTPKVYHDFVLVENLYHFGALVDARGYLYNHELLKMILRHSEPLRGRVVWSACYLDEINKLIDSQRGDQRKVLDNHIREISVRVCDMAKKGLKERLEDMRRPREALQQTRGEEWAEELFSRAWANTEDPKSSHSLFDAPDENPVEQRPMAMDQQRQHEVLIDELCSLAIRSDLLGEATIFKSPESTDLIAFGFAFLEQPRGPNGSQVRLKEKLAVDAAIEHFQERPYSQGQSEYDRALINFLYSEQSNASALGKVSELFFAWHLKKVLGTCADMIIPTLGDDYRKKVLELLIGNAQNVQYLNERSGAQGSLADHANLDNLARFRLVEGKKTAYQEEVNKERTMNMWGWLQAIRNGIEGDDLQSTFWFPSNNTGPDVLFALRMKMPEAPMDKKPEPLTRKKISKATTSLPNRHYTGQLAGKKRKRDSSSEEPLNYSLILCAVQIKRQQRVNEPAKAIATTDPNHWFCKNNARDAQKIAEELREWKDARYPIVRILVSALTDPIPYQGPKNAATEARITSDQQYYTSIGKRDDDLLFGDAFQRLREAQGI